MSKKNQPPNKRVLIAAGGTGGHLFPAQALAQELLHEKKGIELLFAGAGLSTNRYFNKQKFLFEEVSSSTFFRGKTGELFSAFWLIFKGVQKSLAVLTQFKPDLVVGFGSFHSFPLLVAAVLRRVPILLFESNAIPGRVNRFFSRFAKVSAAQFKEAEEKLTGPMVEVAMPFYEKEKKGEITKERALEYFGLRHNTFTLLVFGGSQGATSINRSVCHLIPLLLAKQRSFQIIHITGSKNREEVERAYSFLHIPICVKEFEEEMALAWKIADLAICRAGAATLAELISFEVPALLIPFPRASEDHQRKNAEFMQNVVKGASTLLESDLSVERLFNLVDPLLSMDSKELAARRSAIHTFKQEWKKKKSLSKVVTELLET